MTGAVEPKPIDPQSGQHARIHYASGFLNWLGSQAIYFLTLASAGVIIALYRVTSLEVSDLPLQTLLAIAFVLSTVVIVAMLGGSIMSRLRSTAADRLDIGIRMLQPRASQVMLSDKRRPILMLRAFEDDVPIVRSRLSGTLDPAIFTLEELIAERVRRLGPFVAVGQPETLPWPGGAARNYYEDQDWQKAVISWMTKSILLTVVPGSTPGLTWEIKTVIALGCVNKLLVSMPGGQNQVERWSHLCDCFRDTSWHSAMLHADVKNALAVFFQDNGDIVAIRSTDWSRPMSELAIDLALYGMYVYGLK